MLIHLAAKEATSVLVPRSHWPPKGPLAGLEKYLNSTLPVEQVAVNFCLSGAPPCLPKSSNSLIIHEPKNGSHA